MAALLPLHTQLQDAIRAELAGAIQSTSDDVHDARKRCKKLRAILRLLREPLGDRYSTMNRGIRDAARALSAQRDDDVAAELCAKLEKQTPEMAWKTLPGQLPPPPSHAGDARDARALLTAIDQQLKDEPLPALTPEDLARGLTNGYRRARKRWRRALVDPTDADPLHEWRKEVKYHMHHCQVLAPLWPALKTRRKHLDRVSDGLGDHHDRYMLMHRLQQMDADASKHHSGKLQQLEREQEWLAKRALRQAETLFALSPQSWWQRQVLHR